jgi:Zn-dependent peptidase ImmA (M78 family)
MFRRYLSFLKIASDDFSDIVVNAELHADRVRFILIEVYFD